MLRRLAPKRFSEPLAKTLGDLGTQAVQRSVSKGPDPVESPIGLPKLLEPIRKSLTKNSSTIPKMLRLGVLPSRLGKNVLRVY
jgi:hypothetical protein